VWTLSSAIVHRERSTVRPKKATKGPATLAQIRQRGSLRVGYDPANMIDHAYDYWILGKGAEQKRPRWSIVRDVLGWDR